ncbi:MAG: hypothetical protein A07HR67_02765 [uncultured archaeon A07HR67]|jgi:hypothetical protein|nr:MAG: hypothetical protein A07HR67_02765 [uncultured archaeon A07HR67]
MTDDTHYLNIELSDEAFESLTSYKQDLGLTWNGLLKHGTPYPEQVEEKHQSDRDD